MKKMLSIILSVIMVLSSISCLMTLPASAASWEVVFKEDFESLTGDDHIVNMTTENAHWINEGEWARYYNGGYYGLVWPNDFSSFTNGEATAINNQGQPVSQTITASESKTFRNEHGKMVAATGIGDNATTVAKIDVSAIGLAMSLGELEKETNYKVTLKACKATDDTALLLRIVSSLNLQKVQTSEVIINYMVGNAIDLGDAATLAANTWKNDVELKFNSGALTTAYLFISNSDPARTFYLDDIVVEKEVEEPFDGTFENETVGTSLEVPNNYTWPEYGTFGVNLNQGYYRGIDFTNEYFYNNQTASVITEPYLWHQANADAYTISQNGFKYVGTNIESHPSSSKMEVVAGGANGTAKSLYIKNSSRGVATAVNFPEKDRTYNISFWIKAKGANGAGAIAIASTLNVGNLNGAVDSTTPPSYILAKKTAAEVNDTAADWKKIEFKVEAGNLTKAYIVFSGTGADEFYIDEIKVEKQFKGSDVVFVDAEKDVITDCNAAATVNYEGTVGTVSGLSSDAKFLGWFADVNDLSAPLSTEASYDCKNGGAPVVMVNNLLATSGSFEGIETGTVLTWKDGNEYPSGNLWGFNANAGYFRATKAEEVFGVDGTSYQQIASGTVVSSNEINPTVVEDAKHSGNKALYFSPKYFTSSLGIDVKKNTDYQLSYWILADKDIATNDVVQDSVISTTLNVGTGGKNADSLNAALNQLYNNFIVDIQPLSSVHDGINWKKVTHTFNSGNFEKLYFVIRPTSRQKNAVGFTIDDLYLREVTFTDKLSVDMKSNAAIDPVDCELNKLVVGEMASFKVVHNESAEPIVKANDSVITPVEGVYTFEVKDTNTLSVRFVGDEDLNDYNKDYDGRPLDEYNKDVYLEPVWQGDTVYQESALFMTGKDKVKLLYPVDSVVSLRSYSLDVNYVEGVDYEITSDGQIKRLENSRIPVYSDDLSVDPTTKGTRDVEYPKFAVSVTYKHSKTFEDGYQPSAPLSQVNKIDETIAKLERGENVTIVIYGDSISCGWSSSGLDNTDPDYEFKTYNEDCVTLAKTQNGTGGDYIISVAPYAPTWIEMLVTKLRETYEGQITVKNLSLGGKTAQWGAQQIETRLEKLCVDGQGNPLTPDLMLIGFGVNDSPSVTADDYKASIQSIIDNTRAKFANTEFLLYSPMLPNQRYEAWPQNILLGYESKLDEIAKNDDAIGLLKLTSIFAEIVKSKAPEDYLNTYVNHGNDFTARIYATGILAAMEVDNISTAYNNAAAISTAANSTTNKDGLRVYNSISKKFIADKKIVEYGSLVIRTARFEGELTENTEGVKVGVAYAQDSKDIVWSRNEVNKVYTAYLTGIPKSYYGETYSIRSYAKDESGNYYYGETIEVCLYDIVYAIDCGNAASGTVTAADKDAFYTFAKIDGAYTAYDNWLNKKGYSAGALRNPE